MNILADFLADVKRKIGNSHKKPDGVDFTASVGTEELAHLEIVAAILHQLTRNLCMEDIKKSGFDTYFVDHTVGVYPIAASGVPFDMKYVGVKGDPIADLNEDLAADAAIA